MERVHRGDVRSMIILAHCQWKGCGGLKFDLPSSFNWAYTVEFLVQGGIVYAGVPDFLTLEEAEAYDWDSVEILRQGHDVMEGGIPTNPFPTNPFLRTRESVTVETVETIGTSNASYAVVVMA